MKKNLRKGYNLPVKGAASEELVILEQADFISISPQDFRAGKPKLLVKVGDKVLAGDPLFFDRKQDKVLFTSPVSGVVEDIVYGERRVILEVIVKADKQNIYKKFKSYSLGEELKKEEVLDLLLESGLAGYLLERPFGNLPNFSITPRDIFISAFFTQPLAPSVDLILKGNGEALQMGIDALSTLTSGQVHVTRNQGHKNEELSNLSRVMLHTFKGKHPVGNVGVQIHHIAPISKKDDIVWTISLEGVINLGKLLLTGKTNSRKIVALAGESVKEPKHYEVTIGQKISEIVGEKIASDEYRVISGDVLTGTKKCLDNFLSFSDNQISVIPEVTENEFWGWMKPGISKPSFSKTFFSSFFKKKEYSFNTAMFGGERGLVQTGVYEQVVPMDILPNHLLKSTMFRDFELMENLGILEVLPEDLALCEYVCVSKVEIQEIIRNGLDEFQKEV